MIRRYHRFERDGRVYIWQRRIFATVTAMASFDEYLVDIGGGRIVKLHTESLAPADHIAIFPVKKKFPQHRGCGGSAA